MLHSREIFALKDLGSIHKWFKINRGGTTVLTFYMAHPTEKPNTRRLTLKFNPEQFKFEGLVDDQIYNLKDVLKNH